MDLYPVDIYEHNLEDLKKKNMSLNQISAVVNILKFIILLKYVWPN